MANLGTIGADHTRLTRRGTPILHWYPISGIRVIPGKPTLEMTPLFNRVTSPVQVPGSYSVECYTSGQFSWQQPVDAGLTYTVSLYARKSSGYVASIQGFRVTPQNLLPYLKVIRQSATGLFPEKTFTATMADVTDTWYQLLVSVPILEKGVMPIDFVIPGLPGTSGFFYAHVPDLATRFVTKCWFNWLEITAAAT
ncbi:MAG TPA: hypothetical protein VFA62_08845 [Acidimicrobiia bacterium]|nr:hypothetical protein [Acidimicrobiia bacterium]